MPPLAFLFIFLFTYAEPPRFEGKSSSFAAAL